MRIFGAIPQIACRFPKPTRTVLFDHRKKRHKLTDYFGWKRAHKQLLDGRNNTSHGTRFFLRFGEQSGEFTIKTFLKARNGTVEAQDLRCKAILGTEFLRPGNPTLP